MKGLTTLATIITPEDGTDHKVDLFLAGSITNCPDWQTEVTHMLTHLDINIANPRRPYGLEKTGDEAARQISWEHEMLDRASVTMFWFPAGATQPIALLELGRKMTQERPLIVGTDPNYERSFDVRQQLWLERREKPYHHLPDTALEAAEACYRLKGKWLPADAAVHIMKRDLSEN